MSEIDRFLDYIEYCEPTNGAVAIYQKPFGESPDDEVFFPDMASEDWREQIERLLYEKYPDNEWHFSPPDGVEEWSFIIYRGD